MSETTRMTEPPARLDEQELRKLAYDISVGLVYVPRSEEQVALSFGMILTFLDITPVLDHVGLIYEYLDKAAPTAVNGLPMFFSMKLLHTLDFDQLQALVVEVQEQRNSFLKGDDADGSQQRVG